MPMPWQRIEEQPSMPARNCRIDEHARRHGIEAFYEDGSSDGYFA